jgi:hypothetical protein
MIRRMRVRCKRNRTGVPVVAGKRKRHGVMARVSGNRDRDPAEAGISRERPKTMREMEVVSWKIELRQARRSDGMKNPRQPNRDPPE